MGYEVSTTQDVDNVTQTRLGNLLGNHDNQFAMVRKALKAIVTLMQRSTLHEKAVSQAEIYLNKMNKLDTQVENIIKEGKVFKDINFKESL